MVRIPRELVEQIHLGQCVIFLGSDMPLGFMEGKAPPSRDELANELSQRWGSENSKPLLPEIAEDCEAVHGRHALITYVSDLINNPTYRPQPIHDLISLLPISAIITTNYDTLLEESLRQKEQSFVKVIRDSDAPFATNEDEVCLLKLYGCITQPDSLAITQEDYAQIERRLRTTLLVVRYFFSLKPILFLGFHFDDFTFRRLFSEVTHDLHQFRRRAYAVWENAPKPKVSFWNGRNLDVIDTEPIIFLRELHACLAKKKELPSEPEITTVHSTHKVPYKYLDAYGPDDADIFYGRDADALRLWRKILTYKVTILFGSSGTGKTSLLQAGVGPRLQRVGYKPVLVRLIDEPLTATMQTICRELGCDNESLPDSLLDFLHQHLDWEDRLVIYFDQFEEFFVRHDAKTRSSFIRQIANCLIDTEHEVRYVFSLREDELAHMDELRDVLAHKDELRDDFPFIWNNSHRLVALGRSEAGNAISEPAASLGIHYEPFLIDTLLNDLSSDDGVAPPNLQIACTRLYEKITDQTYSEVQETVTEWKTSYPTHEIADSVDRVITMRLYREMGGAQGILRHYLSDTLSELASDTEEQEKIKDVLKTLVTRQLTKAVLTEQQITSYLGLSLEQTRNILEQLQQSRLVRFLQGDSCYELAHEHLIGEIQKWITSEEIQAREIKELLEWQLKRFQEDQLIELGTLKSINEGRDNSKLHLTPQEKDLILRSTLANGDEVAYGDDVAYWLNHMPDEQDAVGITISMLLTQPNAVQDRIRSSLRKIHHKIKPEIYQQLVGNLLDIYRSGENNERNLAALSLWKVRDQLKIRTRFQLAPVVARTQTPILLKKNLPLLLGIILGLLGLLVLLPIFNRLWPLVAPKPNIEWVFIEEGPFIMGSNEGADDERPVHEVDLDAFEIAKYEVTNSEYAMCVSAWLCEQPDSDVFELEEFADHPVVNVSWIEANNFCQWVGSRLPTEAEWEKAASWNPIEQRKYKWPWGDDWDSSKLVSQEGSERDTVAVDDPKYAVGISPYGLYHMAGNVWEWTVSYYEDYPYVEKGLENLTDASQYRVVRGGSWGDIGEVARTSERNQFYPDTQDSDLGFRCIRVSD